MEVPFEIAGHILVFLVRVVSADNLGGVVVGLIPKPDALLGNVVPRAFNQKLLWADPNLINTIVSSNP